MFYGEEQLQNKHLNKRTASVFLFFFNGNSNLFGSIRLIFFFILKIHSYISHLVKRPPLLSNTQDNLQFLYDVFHFVEALMLMQVTGVVTATRRGRSRSCKRNMTSVCFCIKDKYIYIKTGCKEEPNIKRVTGRRMGDVRQTAHDPRERKRGGEEERLCASALYI